MARTSKTTSGIAPVALDLAENEAMRVSRSAPVVLRVERGTVLVTQRGDYEDHVLEPGDEIFLPRGGLAVAWAFTEATISVRGAARAGAGFAPTRLAA
jgi:Protein of unknown function (DUF2917)